MFDVNQSAYKSFRNIVRERTNRVVAWVGAGLSCAAGLPSWSALREGLCRLLEEKARLCGDDKEKEELERIAKQARKQNLWIAFQLLRESLGRTEYQTYIREQLKPAETCKIPLSYKLLWRLPIKGILNLNLDRLAARAFSETSPGAHIDEFPGRDAGRCTHVLKKPSPFIANLHGSSIDASTWVFTHDELKRLYTNQGYIHFIRSCLINYTVLFIGITADDIAVAKHLEIMSDRGIDFGEHYWLTDRTDSAVLKWAGRYGIRIINYDPHDNHKEVLEFFDDLLHFIPTDEKTHPVRAILEVKEVPPLPSPSELSQLSPEKARQILNAHAAFILQQETEKAHKEYADFCKKYDLAIYHAWYVTLDPPDNKLLGYELEEEIGEGAFSRVFRATSPDGRDVAIKLLRQELRLNPLWLQSFRRGVRAMQILKSRKVHGIVTYEQASEIPAFVVMEYIDGPDLTRAVKAGYIDEWSTVLRVAVDLAHIIREAHLLPERVLHRDLRPSNVMLKGYYIDPQEWEVVVLDFDLSWYRGALGKTVMDGKTMNGFLAPEQVERKSTDYTRNALVDSFGLGMTLFFLRTGIEPQLLQHRHSDWEEFLYDSIEKYKCETWYSLPKRYARLIKFATRDRQEERWDMSQIEGELQQLQDAELNPTSVQSAELWAEELAARVEHQLQSVSYTWDPDRYVACFKLVGGVEIRLKGKEVQHEVEACISWASTGDVEHQRISKFLPKKCERAFSTLRKGGWRFREDPIVSRNDVICRVRKRVPELPSDITRLATSLAEAARTFQFD